MKANLMENRSDQHREYIHLWRPPGADGIELISARLLSFLYGKHFHEEYTIGINDADAGSFWRRSANRATGPKSLNLVTPPASTAFQTGTLRGWKPFVARPSRGAQHASLHLQRT